MEYNEDYEIILHKISAGESHFMDDKRYENYSGTAALWLNHQHKHLFADEILSRYSTYKSMDELLKSRGHEYIPGLFVRRGDKREQVYYDVWWGDEVIEASDPFFPFFFACKLSHVDILNLDEFLDYHLEKNFDYDKEAFFRFIVIIFRRYRNLLKEDTVLTTKEWIELREKNAEISGGVAEEKIKGRIHREQGDHKTILSVNQTALLIEYMQKAGIILQGEYLTYTHAGKAFNILTGYSAHTIRQQLGSKGMQNVIKHEDYQELYDAIMKMAKFIEPNLKK